MMGNTQKVDNLIVSLTSYPARIGTVHLVIESLFKQTLQPEKIILWLAEEQFPNKEKDLPESLLKQTQRGLTVSWCHDIRSYKKLIPALRQYPDAIIVTVDDDNLYEKDVLEKLYKAYLKEPEFIYCHRAHFITLDKNKQLKPYCKFKLVAQISKPLFRNFFTGVGGVLYPPHCLDQNVLNEAAFTRLCPFADDIWFWAHALRAQTKIKVVSKPGFISYVSADTQDGGLYKINVEQNKNDEQLNAVIKAYPEVLERVQNESEFFYLYHFLKLSNIFSYQCKKSKIIIRIFGLRISIKSRNF